MSQQKRSGRARRPPGRPARGRAGQPANQLANQLATQLATQSASDLATAIQHWFPPVARKLPWRTAPRNPYFALVSEAMLQQTQVARVVEYFQRFVGRFPTVEALAAGPEQEVLALWAGLGYYRRARNLHRAARLVVERFGGRVPADASELTDLPGVGQYTAGAIASIAYGRAEAAVDGNVVRVLLRVHGEDLDPSEKATVEWAWARATELAHAAAHAEGPRGPGGPGGPGGASGPGGPGGPSGPGIVSEGLMELGATVCLPPPAAPRCEACPWAGRCRARAEGAQGRIPRPKKRSAGDREVFCAAVVIRDQRGRVLLEQRPGTGMWAGLWQCPTLERADRPATADEVSAFARLKGAESVAPAPGAEAGGDAAFTHQTTHRRLQFAVFAGAAARCGRKTGGRVWLEPGAITSLALSAAQRKVLELAGVRTDRPGAENPGERP